MLLLIDERERDLYDAVYHLLYGKGEAYPIQLVKRVLALGDIAICEDSTEKELVLIERKTLKDLVSSIKDGRYEEQSYRLTHSTGADFHLHNVMYLIEGPLNTLHNPLERKMVLGAMASMHYFKGFSVFKTSSLQDSAEWIVALTHKMEREICKKRLPWFLMGSRAPVIHPSSSIPSSFLSTPEEETVGLTEESAPEESLIHIQTPQAYSSVVKRAKSANLTPENIGEVILCQIPSVGHETARSVMEHYGNSLAALIEALKEKGIECMDGLTTTDSKGKVRKISKTCVANIHRFLLKP